MEQHDNELTQQQADALNALVPPMGQLRLLTDTAWDDDDEREPSRGLEVCYLCGEDYCPCCGCQCVNSKASSDQPRPQSQMHYEPTEEEVIRLFASSSPGYLDEYLKPRYPNSIRRALVIFKAKWFD
jgi:hypothetical protein